MKMKLAQILRITCSFSNEEFDKFAELKKLLRREGCKFVVFSGKKTNGPTKLVIHLDIAKGKTHCCGSTNRLLDFLGNLMQGEKC
ncbi:hypothetical protein KKC32_03645 [Patescibacteria group bacterium]|nr:hypothetical protein [Patescibacteria group bacterium]